MESLIINTVIVSCIVSFLFVVIRIYFTYFAKSDYPNKCQHDANTHTQCKVDAEVKTPAYQEKPKRSRRPKNESAVVKSATKKTSRKKKSQ